MYDNSCIKTIPNYHYFVRKRVLMATGKGDILINRHLLIGDCEIFIGDWDNSFSEKTKKLPLSCIIEKESLNLAFSLNGELLINRKTCFVRLFYIVDNSSILIN